MAGKMAFGMLHVAAVLCLVQGARSAEAPPATKPVWDERPTFEQTYAGYRPTFCTGDPNSEELKFSLQRNYVNVGDVRVDAQVRPIIEKANELAFGKNEYRKAVPLYRQIIDDYPDDMFLIAGQGIFIPAALYVQHQILRFPEKELTYYRVLFDPAARDIYERAVKRYSIFDYKEIVKNHLATSYGDDALFALGNDAMDKGDYNEARRCYERIVTYHGQTDTDQDNIALHRDNVWVRLAMCYRYLGNDAAFAVAVAKIGDKTAPSVARLLEQLKNFKYDAFRVRQREGRRSAAHDAMDDRSLSEPMPFEFSANRGEWRVPLPRRSHTIEPEALPWATETDLIYKDFNVLYSRSLLTGELNWVFAPGGASRDWDCYGGGWGRADFQPNQNILVQDGAVFAHMFVYGPSLVAVDQYTGRLLWAKGPMAARTPEDWLDRYQTSPAGARGMVIAPVVFDDIRGRTHISSAAELAAYEPRTGQTLWRTKLARIAPLKITQSRYPRKIRIFSTTPLVDGNAVYHVTNAGVVACVDAGTGDIRWLTRYPQSRQALDNLSHPGAIWRNEAPVIRGSRLYVTPLDSGFLLCLDTETGRILWEATQSHGASWESPPPTNSTSAETTTRSSTPSPAGCAGGGARGLAGPVPSRSQTRSPRGLSRPSAARGTTSGATSGT